MQQQARALAWHATPHRFVTAPGQLHATGPHALHCSATWHAFPDPIYRVDATRAMYMHRFGGLYFDLDFYCLRPLAPTAAELSGVVLGYMVRLAGAGWGGGGLLGCGGGRQRACGLRRRLCYLPGWLLRVRQHTSSRPFKGPAPSTPATPSPPPQTDSHGFEHAVPNAFLASEPRQAFWLFFLSRIGLQEELTEWQVRAKGRRASGPPPMWPDLVLMLGETKPGEVSAPVAIVISAPVLRCADHARL